MASSTPEGRTAPLAHASPDGERRRRRTGWRARLARSWRKLLDQVRERLETRRLLLRYARSDDVAIQAGRWHVSDQHARHVGAAFSEHLATTKALRGVRGPAAQALMHVADVLFGTSVGGPHGGGATIVVRGRRGDQLLLAPERGYVERVAHASPFDERYADLRVRIARHVRSPAFALDATRRVERSDYLDGVTLDGVERHARVEAMRDVLRAFTALALAEQHGSSRAWLDAQLERLVLDASPDAASLGDALGDQAVRAALSGGGLVPSHGDASARNIVLVGATPYLIDFTPDRVALRPWWFDALYFVCWGAYPTSVEPFLSGDLDREIMALLAAGGVGDLDVTRRRHALAALTLALGWCSHGGRPPEVAAGDVAGDVAGDGAGRVRAEPSGVPMLEGMWRRYRRVAGPRGVGTCGDA